MKVALKQSAMPTNPTANQDFTDGVFSSDVKLLLPFFGRAVANATITGQAGLSIGGSDGTNQASISHHIEDDLITTSDGDSRAFTTNTACLADAVTNSSIAEAAGSLLSNGGRLAWTDWNANELINALLVGGSDVLAAVSNGVLNSTTDVPITHGLGATPDVIIAFTINRDAVNNGTQAFGSIGFYDVVNNTYASVAYRNTNATTTSVAQALYTDSIVSNIEVAGTRNYRVTLNDIGATTFDMVADAVTANAPTTPPVVFFICLKVTNGTFKVGTFLTKTSTGVQVDISGMAAKPKLEILLPTFLTALDTISNATTPSSLGFGAAVDNESVTEQACASCYAQDAIVLGNPTPVTNTESYTSNSKAGFIFDSAGAAAVEFSVDSWISGGVSHNYSTANASGRYVAYLAIAQEAAAATPLMGQIMM